MVVARQQLRGEAGRQEAEAGHAVEQEVAGAGPTLARAHAGDTPAGEAVVRSVYYPISTVRHYLARSTVAATAQGARVVRARLWVECSVRIATLITPVMFTTDLPIDR